MLSRGSCSSLSADVGFWPVTDGYKVQDLAVLTFVIWGCYAVFALVAGVDMWRFYTISRAADDSEAAPSHSQSLGYGAAGAALADTQTQSSSDAQKFVASADAGAGGPVKSDASPVKSDAADAAPAWSSFAITALVTYRFYSGFNSATWLPYLLAKEGECLWEEDQAFFMAIAKLLYGATMLLNPCLGLWGDRAVEISHGPGRRLFIWLGVLMAAMGMLLCICSDASKNFWMFMVGILFWRMGEACNDVTVEALAPEMVPPAQYQTASAIKAAIFLIGGVVGYVALILLADYTFDWVYTAYLIGMLVCTIPQLIILSVVDNPRIKFRYARSDTFLQSMAKAYLAPMRMPGGFPMACVAVFIFSLGTAPMFFLLLMVRDLMGMHNEVSEQRVFSYLSIIFFISAAIASVVLFVGSRPELQGQYTLPSRIRSLCCWIVIFALVAVAMPFMAMIPDETWKEDYFYCMAMMMGFAFGTVFSRFQDCTWQLLPANCDMANSMGFNVMSRNTGVGFGNFLAGMALDFFPSRRHTMSDVVKHRKWLHFSHPGTIIHYLHEVPGYTPMGYYVMCGTSGIMVLFSAVAAYLSGKKADELSRQEAEPLAA